MGQISASIVRALVDFQVFNEAMGNSAQKMAHDTLKMARESEQAAWERFERSMDTHGVRFEEVVTHGLGRAERLYARREGAMKREIERRNARKAKLAAQAV